MLDEEPRSLLAPNNLLNDESGVKSVLFGAYKSLANSTGCNRCELGILSYSADIAAQHSGGEERFATQYQDFTIGPELGFPKPHLWDTYWRAIRGVPEISISDFSSKEELRNHLMEERGWELWWEGHRRFDLIRMGVYIDRANNFLDKPNAQPFHTRYPIPQAAIDANPALEQNPGY